MCHFWKPDISNTLQYFIVRFDTGLNIGFPNRYNTKYVTEYVNNPVKNLQRVYKKYEK